MTQPKEQDASGMNRRTFFKRVCGGTTRVGLAGGGLAGLLAVGRDAGEPEGARAGLGIVRPPNAVEQEEEFLAKCIRCTRCADACEAQCIQYFDADGGHLQGSPYILPLKKACTMCLKCGDACPTGAILPVARKEDVAMGVAVVDERLCVSHNGTGICGACHTACPLHNRAITQNYRNQPTVHPDYCTGCGLCEEACIVDDRAGVRAIQVHTVRKWQAASAQPRLQGAARRADPTRLGNEQLR